MLSSTRVSFCLSLLFLLFLLSAPTSAIYIDEFRLPAGPSGSDVAMYGCGMRTAPNLVVFVTGGFGLPIMPQICKSMQLISGDAMLVTFDFPGIGKSEGPVLEDLDALDAMTSRIVDESLVRYGRSSVTMMGWASGGWTVLRLARLRPDVVSSAVCVGTPLDLKRMSVTDVDWLKMKTRGRLENLFIGDPDDALVPILQQVINSFLVDAYGGQKASCYTDFACSAFVSEVIDLLNSQEYNLADFVVSSSGVGATALSVYKDIRLIRPEDFDVGSVPTYFVYGVYDGFIPPKDVLPSVSRVGGSDVHVQQFNGSAHLVISEEPEAFTSWFRDSVLA